MADEIKISGLQEVQKALYSYSQQLGDKVVIDALKLGANVVKKEIQRTAPVYKGAPSPRIQSGTLRKGFKVSKSKIFSAKRYDGKLGVYLTLKKGKGRGDLKDPFYGKFLESGFRNKQGLKFIDAAYNSKKEAAATLIVSAAEAAADQLSKKLGF